MLLHWTSPTSNANLTARLENNEAVMETSSGRYYAPVTVRATGRTLTRSCFGSLGTRAMVTFEDGVTVTAHLVADR